MSSGDPIDNLGPRNVLHLPRPLFNLLLRSNFEDLSDFEIAWISLHRFVSSVLPPGAEDLKGNEVETIIKFKAALGIDDPDAANVHMEIGRRIFRERLETGDREADMEQRKVDIAIRENAKRLYAFKLQSVGRNIDAKQLIDLRKAQLLYRLSDE
ncbi:Protein TIC110, chloroplastic, partial [Ananas comosus]